ncbi:MAG: Ig-like domain-containing domain [Candidatus Kapabacteria bacterium]|jgi:uncharacterized protein (DUF2141 family)|nr:Ig-like domain-containing domain [Candidatus Kapabacteria bacterium]
MKFRIRQKELRILLLISILIFGACANSQPPSGGPPDTVPPTILGNVPTDKTRNFSGKSVEIEFSKYMNRAQVNESIFISPSVKYQTDWSGKNLEIEFQEDLDSNTTYSILLGTEYSDIRSNKPEKAFLLIFSTGKSLDSGAINGELFDPKPAGAFIFGHRIDNIDPDTLDIRRVKPDYRTQVGTNGKFEFGALKNGKYRLTAVRDEYKDEVYDEGTDAFGASLFDVVVKADTVPYIPIRIGPPVDNQGPMLFGAEAIKDNIFVLSFNERIDSSTVNGKSFSISDSLNLVAIEITAAYPDHKDDTRVILETSEAVDTLKVWKISCAIDSEFSLKDSLNNSMCDTAFVSYFLGFHEADTTLPLIVEYPFKDSTRKISPEATFNYIFNRAIDQTGFGERIVLETLSAIDSGVYVPVECSKSFTLANMLTITPAKQLESESWYRIRFAADSILALNGLIGTDTINILNFMTADIRNFGGASGILKRTNGYAQNCYVTVKSKNGKNEFITKVDILGKWEFLKLPDGDYFIEVFEDTDGNGRYSYGSVFPYRFAEPFAIVDKEIKIRPRWKNVEEIIINFE